MSDAAARFSRDAKAYAASAGHSRGADLEMALDFAEPSPADVALDVATGPGHLLFRLAPRVGYVVGLDPAPGMIAIARAAAADRRVGNAAFLLGEAERLPFPSACFSLATTRLGLHHFSDQALAIRELARVLAPGGRVVIEDSLAPPDPEGAIFLNEAERFRDPTHVRSLTDEEWRDELQEAGLRIVGRRSIAKSRTFDEWIVQGGVAERASEIEAWILSAPPALRDRWFRIEAGRVTRFTDEKVILIARELPTSPRFSCSPHRTRSRCSPRSRRARSSPGSC